MATINASPGKLISIGYEGEDKVTKIVFRYDAEWLAHGNGVFKVRVLRHGDTEAYNATEVIDNREAMTLTMTVTDIELSVKGHGEMQVVYIGSDFVKKSPVYRYNVSRAIDSEIVNPPQGSIINEIAQSVGDLTELTTTNKDNLVDAINEVNAKEGGGGSVTVDDELSGSSENPVQNKVISGALAGKADKTYVDSALSDKANTADVNTALSTKANTSDVNTALSGKADKSYVDTELADKANAVDVNTALSAKANTSDVNSALALKANTADMNTALALKANSADVQIALAGKASTDVATQSANGLMSAQDKTKLDGLGDGISDVQINGTSIVTDGVAEIPIGGTGVAGVYSIASNGRYGLMINSEELRICPAETGLIKSPFGYQASDSRPIVPKTQHMATFYGLAYASGTDMSKSNNPVGTYTEEAKASIRTMLGLQDVYEDYSSALTALGVTES